MISGSSSRSFLLGVVSCALVVLVLPLFKSSPALRDGANQKNEGAQQELLQVQMPANRPQVVQRSQVAQESQIAHEPAQQQPVQKAQKAVQELVDRDVHEVIVSDGDAVTPGTHIQLMQRKDTSNAECHVSLGVRNAGRAPLGAAPPHGCSDPLPMPTFRPRPSCALTAIHTVKIAVSNALYSNPDTYLDGHRADYKDDSPIMTMVGLRRLDNYQWLIEEALANGIPGNVIETGVWRGGCSAVAATTLRVNKGGKGRATFLADSFEGIPVSGSKWKADAATDHFVRNFDFLNRNSPVVVLERLRRLGLTNTTENPIIVLKGWFSDTLAPARDAGRFADGFAVIRLDGDSFMSTWQAIEVLYPLLHPGGYVIIDDYFDWEGCYKAVHEYRKQFGITAPIVPVWHSDGEEIRGAWWQKPLQG